MNAFKKSPVLNRQCLRNKIEELSPLLLKQLNLGICNKDLLFQAIWGYYASGCQERLKSIRRRIEQNVKIVVPRTQHCQNLNPSLAEISLPPGLDLEDHIYHELVSCFRSSDEGLAKAKSSPKRPVVKKELNSVQYSTLEQWYSWKYEEQEVRQLLIQSNDPYRAEELNRKLEKLNKLIHRHPLIVLPNQPEEPKISDSKETKRLIFENSANQPELIPKPGPYVNRSSKDSMNSAVEAGRLRKPSTKDTSEASQGSKSSLINLKIKPSTIESTSKDNKDSFNISRDDLKLDFKNKSGQESPKKHFEAKLSTKEKLKKSIKNKYLKPSQVSEFRNDQSSFKVKNKRNQLKNRNLSDDSVSFHPDLIRERPRETSSRTSSEKNFSEMSQVSEYRDEFPGTVENHKHEQKHGDYLNIHLEKSRKSKPSRTSLENKSPEMSINQIHKTKHPDAPVNSLFFNPDFQDISKESKSSRSILKNKSSVTSHEKSENSKYKAAVKRKPIQKFIPSSSSDTLLVKPGYKPHRDQYSFRLRSTRKAHSWHSPKYMKFKDNLDWNKHNKAKHRVSRISQTNHRIYSIRKAHSWHSASPAETQIQFRANRPRRKASSASYAKKLISKERQETKNESIFQYDWPLPVGMKHTEYFKPYDHSKSNDKVQTFPEINVNELRKSLIAKPMDELKPPKKSIPFLESDFTKYARARNYSILYAKSLPSSVGSNEDLCPPPMIISKIIKECINEYGSEISFKDTFNNFMKPNKLDKLVPEISIKEPLHKMARRDKNKKKKNKRKFTKKLLKKPSKGLPPPCSLCNLVRRRQSELRPYMKRMQMQRQRQELQTYYTQKILKKRPCQEQDPQETKTALRRQALTRCYQVLKICKYLLELNQLQRSQECRS